VNKVSWNPGLGNQANISGSCGSPLLLDGKKTIHFIATVDRQLSCHRYSHSS
jgi:hypothetical protein